MPSRDDITEDILRRAEDAGLDTLVVTADVPVNAKRERNIRSGWVRPYKPTLPIMLEALLHPAWVAEYLRHGLPMMQTFQPYAPAGASARAVAAFYATISPHSFAWSVAEGCRRRWRGKLVIKGLLHPEDARRARDLGAATMTSPGCATSTAARSIMPSPGARSTVSAGPKMRAIGA